MQNSGLPKLLPWRTQPDRTKMTFIIGDSCDNLRLIGNYGYNCTVKTVSTTTTYKDYYGLNIGVGYSFGGIDSSGVALDLMLIDTRLS